MEKILNFILVALLIMAATNSFADNEPLRIPLHAAKVSLDPGGIQDLSSLFVSRQVNCQLVRSYGSVITLEAAEAVRFITPTKIMIRIKKDAVFQDGSPVTADDVVASLDHLKKSRHTLRNVFNWIQNIEIINKKEICIILKEPVPQFLNILSSPNYAIFKKEFLVKAGRNPLLWRAPLGCGKYRIINDSQDIIKLAPLHEGRSVEFHLNQNDQLTADDIDNYDIADLSITGLSNNILKFRTIEIFDPTQIYLGLNTQSEHWKKREDRCGFIAKLDTNEVLKKYSEQAKPAADILPEGILGYMTSIQALQTMKQKFESNKIPRINQFCLSYLTVSIPKQYRPEYKKMIEKIYPNIITKDITDNKRFGSEFVKSRCDSIIVGIKSNTLDGYDFLATFSMPDPNFTGFADKGMAREIEESQNEADPKQRSYIYRRLVEKIENNCLAYPILTIPMKLVYIRKELNTPNIGKGPLNEYDLSEVQ